ncbi:MAG: NAD(P)-dependent alcohol dehydrogenase [Verrucomicrobiota bacterium]
MHVPAYSTREPGRPFERSGHELPDEIGPDQVEIAVETCGICHSDLSMKNNDWGLTSYPFVGGHEVVGTIERVGAFVTNLKVGQLVGLGWYSGSCLTCPTCLRGDHNLCPKAEATIVSRHGGFASHVRAQSIWCVPLPATLSPASAGPLFCGGITVFNPIIQNGIIATDSVAVVGIGGLGHLALQFLSAWGCEVTAISTNPDKEAEARSMGADHFLNARDEATLKASAERFDLILVTVNVALNWPLYLGMLKRQGKLHIVGATPPVEVSSEQLIEYQKSVTGSPLGSPALVGTMLDFCARKQIAPITQSFPMSEINQAFAELEAGKPRYRLVLVNDF